MRRTFLGSGESLAIGIRDCSISEEGTVDRWEGDVRLARLQTSTTGSGCMHLRGVWYGA